jgi:hypothetical protein
MTDTDTRDVVYFTYINDDLHSTALECIWYDVFSKRLFVEFPSGSVAGYANVPVRAVEELETAKSVGSHYSRNIKPIYHGVNSNVDLKAFNESVWSNTSPGYVPTKRTEEADDWKNHDTQEAMLSEYSEIVDEHAEGEYKISFAVEASTNFKAPRGNIVNALNLFVEAFNRNSVDGATIRVRSIEEIV